MSNIFKIQGNLRDRFVQDAVLLSLLDPVRGEPTVHGLDQDPHETGTELERLLKRRFLNAFALISSTRRDIDTLSAACLEEGAEGTVVRVARTTGMVESDLQQLRSLVAVLNNIARGGPGASNQETVLARIISLDISMVRHYLRKIRAAEGDFGDPVTAIDSRLIASAHSSGPALQRFLEWFRQVFVVRDLPPDAKPEDLVPHILWARDAKQHHFEFLKAAFCPPNQRFPDWVSTIFKLGRYGMASTALIQLATEFPALFNPMTVEPVQAPLPTRFAIPEPATPLTSVLRRVDGNQAEDYRSRLAVFWNVADPETYFRQACTLDLVAHAEIQLVSFYDHNPHLTPSIRYLGVSKRSCYLCRMFLSYHQESFSISSCHQKLSPSWIPPTITYRQVYLTYKSLLAELSTLMETTARRELENRLGGPRRNAPTEPMAGVSATGLIDRGNERVVTDFSHGSKSPVARNAGPEDSRAATNGGSASPESPLSPFHIAGMANANTDIGSPGMRNSRLSSSHETLSPRALVFHFLRADDSNRQDIVRASDIMDPATQFPSWDKLVEIIKNDADSFGLAFQEGHDFLMFNKRIRVANERQFLACVQHLCNAKLWNVDVRVHSPVPEPMATTS